MAHTLAHTLLDLVRAHHGRVLAQARPASSNRDQQHHRVKQRAKVGVPQHESVPGLLRVRRLCYASVHVCTHDGPDIQSKYIIISFGSN